MMTRAQIKYIRSLTLQKFRNENKLFIAEGEKVAGEWLASGKRINTIVGTPDWIALNTEMIGRHPEAELCSVKGGELEQMSAMQTPNNVLLVIPMEDKGPIPLNKEWYLALDEIQDPGNMGTIIRIADWFGIGNIVCSPGCADVYNPKVVQSAMGGHLRVNIYESNLVPFLQSIDTQKVAATLGGESVYSLQRSNSGVLIIGNESQGISAEVLKTATIRVTIPRRGGAESLNAGVSAGILCALLLPC